MGQCSTLPAEGRTPKATKRSDSISVGQDSQTGKARDKMSTPKQPYGKKNSFLHVQTQNLNAQTALQFANAHNEPAQPKTQLRDPAQAEQRPDPMEEEHLREEIPPPPDIAVRTRCYRLNLDSEINPNGGEFLGPFADSPPPLTYSDSEDSSETMSPVEVAVCTAKIFRGITVAKDGTILTQNARATRSSRGSKNKRGEKSRQATKIDKAKDLVEESIRTGKAPDSDKPANMLSLVVMGDYDDMKHLVRDGSKKLRDGAEKPDELLLAVNHPRGGMAGPSFAPQSNNPAVWSPRKRLSPHNSSMINGGVDMAKVGSHGAGSVKSRPFGLPQSPAQRLKGHPRDHRPSQSARRYSEEAHTRSGYHKQQEVSERNMQSSGRHPSPNNAPEGDWSNAMSFSRGFHSIWNCGGNGEETGTISPTQVVTTRDGKTHAMNLATATAYRKPVFEGRDNNLGQMRESGITTRAN